jgi:hypothetical protein
MPEFFHSFNPEVTVPVLTGATVRLSKSVSLRAALFSRTRKRKTKAAVGVALR